jgi:Putative auto-transporter adhesin, head GIN domain
MKKLAAVILFLGMIKLGLGQQKTIRDGNAQARTVSAFHGIKVATGIHLYLSQGAEDAVAVSASEKEYRDHIRTEVVDGILKIYYENDDWKSWFRGDDKHLRAYVSVKTLDQLKASSGAQIEVDGVISARGLRLDFSSGSIFKGNIAVSELTLQQNSGSQANIGGKAENTTIDASSGSQLDGYELETESCDAKTSSGASVSISIRKKLNASASSGGQIRYKGDATISMLHSSSGGQISKG